MAWIEKEFWEFGNAFAIWFVLRSVGKKNKNIIDRSR
jgi:hypothetical protein